MNEEAHERAARLIDVERVEGLTAAERGWLEGHLETCPTCRERAQATERAIRAVRSVSVEVLPSLVSATRQRMYLRGRELRGKQPRLRALWISCAFSWILGVMSAPLLWQATAWFGRRFDLSQAVWITLFALLWIVPATLVSAVLAWQRSRTIRTEDTEFLP